MNKNQQRILIGIVIIVAAMLVYPPFKVTAHNGAIFNMGYDWILAPPKRGYIVATVNASMLMIQWIGVLIVGGIAFFLVKNPKKELQVFSVGTNHSTAEQPHHNLELPCDNQSTVETDVTNPDNGGYVDSKLSQLSQQSEMDSSNKAFKCFAQPLLLLSSD